MDKTEQKKVLREQIRGYWQRSAPEERLFWSEQIWKAVEALPQWEEACSVALYYSIAGEPVSHKAVERAGQSKEVWLPQVAGDEIVLRRYEGELRRGAFGIMEPTGRVAEEADLCSIDIIVVPGVAFDPRGRRLGRGGGFYDRLLPRMKAFRVGVCLPWGLVGEVPTDEWDCRMDVVLSAPTVVSG